MQQSKTVGETSEDKVNKSFRKKGTIVPVSNLNKNEEAIFIEDALLLQPNYFSRVMHVPLLSILSLFIFPLYMYWSIDLKVKWLYKQAPNLSKTTNILVVSKGK